MSRPDLNDLASFRAVAQERSFTRAAVRLGVSQSALSQTIHNLEERLGVLLLARTTRSVAPTEAGERLLQAIGPHLESLDAAMASLKPLNDAPSGTIRITTSEHAATAVLYPAVRRFGREYPDVTIELSVDNAFADIVAGRFDAGVRLGEQVEKDMVAVRIAPDMRMAIVATPDYLQRFGRPTTPRDLVRHRCVNMRLPTHGNLMPWEFETNGHEFSVHVEGNVIVNTSALAFRAVVDGLGLGYCLEDLAAPHVAKGDLVRMLEDWCPTFPGYHLYYPTRRLHSPAFALFVERLRFRG